MPNTIVYNTPQHGLDLYPYRVLAAGRSRFTPKDPAISTRFNEHTLILTTDGEGEITWNGVIDKLQPITVSWVDTSAEYRHCCAGASKAWTYLWLSFAGHASDQLFAHLARREQLHVISDPEAIETFKQVLEEIPSNHPSREATLSGLVAKVLALFENGPSQLGGHEDLQRLADALTSNLADHWDTKSMAAKAGLSVSRFHAVFRREFGIPPATWLREQRIIKAKQLLTETDKFIATIGEDCGYPDPHHFSREFSKSAMLSPSKFRTQMRTRVTG